MTAEPPFTAAISCCWLPRSTTLEELELEELGKLDELLGRPDLIPMGQIAVEVTMGDSR